VGLAVPIVLVVKAERRGNSASFATQLRPLGGVVRAEWGCRSALTAKLKWLFFYAKGDFRGITYFVTIF